MAQLETARHIPGHSSPLGATWDGYGVNFAVYSANASLIELCLFDAYTGTEEKRLPLIKGGGHIWSCYVPEIEPGQLYGFRAHGPYEPSHGQRFNANKLLIDPYTKALAGDIDWNAPVYGYVAEHHDADLSFDERDSAEGMPKSVVVDSTFDWQDDAAPRTPWTETVIYETHVKGLTKLHPDLPEDERGTYRALGSPPVIEYLKELGVTAVELLPVHAHADSKRLLDLGLVNYWGYDTIAFFAPDARYSCSGDRGGQVTEFKEMVRNLHRAGLEVILDVVYNHTGEGNERGPTLSFRGLDNRSYYHLRPEDKRFYVNMTGTGNTVNAAHPQVLQLIMDSLRYWVEEMHVDGFRFDLTATLERGIDFNTMTSAFVTATRQDPVLAKVKLIAEPWDVGYGGYRVGAYPHPWSEWNDRFRDDVRYFWRGDAPNLRDMAHRLAASPELAGNAGRPPRWTINFVTAHDGYTLNDLVSYEQKHNEANGENNKDGHNDNISRNFGVEGPTTDEKVLEERARQMRNFLLTLFCAQGTPMLHSGDETGRTKLGNNNTYCQDNEISWHVWDWEPRDADLLEFTKRVSRLRAEHPSLRRRRFLTGEVPGCSETRDSRWYRPDGDEFTEADWNEAGARCLTLVLNDELCEIDNDGQPVRDVPLILLMNAKEEPLEFVLPAFPRRAGWSLLVDTARPAAEAGSETHDSGGTITLTARSCVLMEAWGDATM